jgi:long-chain fatty acid transport protein
MTGKRTTILVSACLFSAISLTLASPVSAGPLFELTGANQGLGGFNARVTGASAASTYFNPALIPLAEPGLGLGIFAVSDQVSLVLDGRDGGDIPVGISSYANANRTALSPMPIPTSWLDDGINRQGITRSARPRQSRPSSGATRSYSTIGLISPVYERYLVLGLNAAIPLGGFTAAKAFYSDEREQYFSNSLHPELLSDRLDAADFAFGVGSRLTDGLSLGLSFTLSLENNAFTPVYVPDAAKLDQVLIDADIRVNTTVAPHFGLVVDPHPRLRVGVTIHTAQSMKIGTNFTYLLNSGMEQNAQIVFTHSYVPWNVGVGASYDLIKPPPESPKTHQLSLVGTALLNNWNDYRDRHNERPSGNYTWSRTINPSVGVRYAYSQWGSMLDLIYVPSPVPLQTGRTNYVDNDRAGLNAGVQYNFTLAHSQFRIELQAQTHYLFDRYQKKIQTAVPLRDNDRVIDEVPEDVIDLANNGKPAAGRDGLQTNNPGWPGFESYGWIFAGGLQVAIVFK